MGIATKLMTLYDEAQKVALESLNNQLNDIDQLNTHPILKEIYKADAINKTVFGQSLFYD